MADRSDPSPSIDQAINAGYPWIEIKCSRCKTPRGVDLATCPTSPRPTFTISPAGCGARSAARPASGRPPSCCSCGSAARLEARRDRADTPSDKEPTREKWNILYGDVCAGSIGLRAGVPNHADQWEWRCGFHPGCDRTTGGPAGTFEQARAAFEAEWQLLLPTLTEADFQAWQDQRDWTKGKQVMWARGEKLPSQQPSSLMRCPCGAMFDSHRPAESHVHRQHIYAAQKKDRIRR